MPPARVPESPPQSSAHARPPQSSQKRAPEPAAEPDPTGQSPDAPIEFTADSDVARGNEERANAEPEPAALHAAEVPGKPDVAAERREIAKQHDP